MQFQKYPAIENSYQQKWTNKIVESGYGNNRYVVQEKVHGANFSFWLDGTTMKLGRRGGFLEQGEPFFNSADMVARHAEKMLALYQVLKEKQPEMVYVAVFGELIGGAYPHPQVAAKPALKGVQKGLYYCPDIEFVGFDILIFSGENKAFLGVEETNECLENANILFLETLFQGNLDDCLKYSNKFQTTLPRLLFGLPEIEDNICEGVVIKPEIPAFIGSNRLIIKNKNERWTERGAIPKSVSTGDGSSQEAQVILEQGFSMITENRLNNVISKIGDITKEKIGQLVTGFKEDVFAELALEEGFSNLSKKEQGEIKRLIMKKAAAFVKGS